jgi:Ohr subfamily peroxiredoxin
MEYTAKATADGNGRNGRAQTDDGLVDVQLAIPAELGGAGGGSNPEQLFAAGYAGCFMSAVASVARQHKVKLNDPSVDAAVTIAHGEDGFGLSVELTVNLLGVPAQEAHVIVEGAHQRCPYSRAVRGNIPVTLRLKIDSGPSTELVPA